MNAHREQFSVHTYEVDAFNQLSVPKLAGFLQEVASNHAAALGVGIDALRSRGLTWVVVRQQIEILEPIALGERLEVLTWPSGIDRLAAMRDYEVRRADGSVAARGLSHWFVLDFTTRRPVRPDEVVGPELQVAREHGLAVAREKLPRLETWDSEARFPIRFEDIDVNLHANNVSYLSWAMEAVPQALWKTSRLASVDIQYLAECGYGTAVLSRLAAAGDRGFLHGLAREDDGSEVARLRTQWLPRAASKRASEAA